jgi:hypothetical protein
MRNGSRLAVGVPATRIKPSGGGGHAGSWLDNRHILGLLFLLPTAALLVAFLTYPLGLGTWLGFTDAKIGRSGEFIGLENFEFLWGDSVTRLALFNTIFYTHRERYQVRTRPVARVVIEQASAVQGVPPRDRVAAIHRADGALRDCLLVDLRLAVLDHQLGAATDGPHPRIHRFPG